MKKHAGSAQEARRKLYELIRSDAPFEQKAEEALELGRRYLGVENGHLTRIDRETEHWEALISTDAVDGRFPPGLELDLGETFCRRTITESAPIALHDAPNQGWSDDPAFEAHALHCYHGTTIVIEGKPYGTVCFVAGDPREEAFSNGETMFVELITRLLERELERERHEAELAKQANLATVLNRVLRHNLRNDMAVIRGYTQLMANELPDVQAGETALDHIDSLIEFSEKARELDRVVAAESEREPTDIVALVREIVEAVGEDYENASVRFDGDDPITVAVLPSFGRAVEELVENACKHGGDSPTVGISIAIVPNAVEIEIADDGPGLADHEREVLRTGAETPLIHGSGLGLWLVHWIVTSHNGSVEAAATESGTTMTISIPRTYGTDVQRQLSRLVRARDQYRAAFEEATDAMVIIDDGARIVDANAKAEELYGMNGRALLGRSIPEFLPDDFDFERAWYEFQDDGKGRDTVTITGADGVTRQVEYSATTDIIPGQHLVVSRVITEQIEREVKLQ